VIDTVPLKIFCRNYLLLLDRQYIEKNNSTGSFLLDVVQKWIDCQRREFWAEADIGLSSWKCNLSLNGKGGHNAGMEYVCHAFVSWFAGANCGKKDPFAVTEELLISKGLCDWCTTSRESSNLQCIMVASRVNKGKQDYMCLRANDKTIIYLLTHVILPATGYSKSHTNRLAGFTKVFLQQIYQALANVFAVMNSKHVIRECDQHNRLPMYKSQDATWAKEEEVFLEVMVSLMFLFRFSPQKYAMTVSFTMAVRALRHTYECSSKTIATQTAIEYHWDPADQDLHTCVLRYMFLDVASVVPE
jgi:hypothetical protein